MTFECDGPAEVSEHVSMVLESALKDDPGKV